MEGVIRCVGRGGVCGRRRGITVVRYNKDRGANIVIPGAASGAN